MTIFLQLLISGILVGCVFGLIAMGFVITYRSSHVFNMAYGQFALIGAFMAWTFLGSPDAPRLPVPLALFLTLLFAIALGLFVERVFFRRMIGRPMFATFILTLGLFAVFNAVTMLAWGPQQLALAQTFPKGPLHLGEIVLAQEYVWNFVITILVLIGLVFFFRLTKLGLAIRAAHDDQVAARCLGVSARLNQQIAWIIGTLLATIGGILIGSVQGISMLLSELVLSVLAVVLLGGMDSLVGCIVGGLVLAIGGTWPLTISIPTCRVSERYSASSSSSSSSSSVLTVSSGPSQLKESR
jgi:branched-chain amino acid transport system permease protein